VTLNQLFPCYTAKIHLRQWLPSFLVSRHWYEHLNCWSNGRLQNIYPSLLLSSVQRLWSIAVLCLATYVLHAYMLLLSCSCCYVHPMCARGSCHRMFALISCLHRCCCAALQMPLQGAAGLLPVVHAPVLQLATHL
jgi:hypothetical protein